MSHALKSMQFMTQLVLGMLLGLVFQKALVQFELFVLGIYVCLKHNVGKLKLLC